MLFDDIKKGSYNKGPISQFPRSGTCGWVFRLPNNGSKNAIRFSQSRCKNEKRLQDFYKSNHTLFFT
jgi:hypothetical protein